MKLGVTTSLIDSKERFKKKCFRARSWRAVHWHLQLMYEQLYAEEHFDIQNVGVICSLLPKFSCICNLICILLTAHPPYSKFLKKFGCYYFIQSRIWNFFLLVPEILEHLLYTTNLCPSRPELEAGEIVPIARTSCFLAEALVYEILLAQNQRILQNDIKINFRDPQT